MPAWLVYIETLNPSTIAIERTAEPVGFIRRERIRDARVYAQRVFNLRNNQRPYLYPVETRFIKRIIKRQETAVKRGLDAAFLTHYRAVLTAGNKRRNKKHQGGAAPESLMLNL